MDSGSVFLIVFGVILLVVVVGALIARAGNRQAGGADEGSGAREPGGAGAGQIHQDPDPDRLAGGRASTHGHQAD